YRQQDAVARAHVADVEVAAPLALAVQAGRHLALRGHAQRAEERRDRPGKALAGVQRAVACRAAGSGRVPEDLGPVLPRHFRPARGLAEWAAARADRDPGVVIDQDVLDGDNEPGAAFPPL